MSAVSASSTTTAPSAYTTARRSSLAAQPIHVIIPTAVVPMHSDTLNKGHPAVATAAYASASDALLSPQTACTPGHGHGACVSPATYGSPLSPRTSARAMRRSSLFSTSIANDADANAHPLATGLMTPPMEQDVEVLPQEAHGDDEEEGSHPEFASVESSRAGSPAARADDDDVAL